MDEVEDWISNGLGDEEYVSKAKFVGSPDSNSPCGGEGLCVVANENLRANLRAFSLSWHPKLSFSFLGVGGGELPPGSLLIVPAVLGMSSTAVFIEDNLLLLQD